MRSYIHTMVPGTRYIEVVLVLIVLLAKIAVVRNSSGAKIAQVSFFYFCLSAAAPPSAPPC